MKYSETVDRLKRVVLQPEVTRAFWSRARAWQGEDVKLFVETRHVPDDAEVRIEFWEDATEARRAPPGPVAKLEGSHKVKNNRLVVDYKLAWDRKSLGRAIELVSPRREFYFLVTIEALKLQKRSTLMYVDLHDFRLSG